MLAQTSVERLVVDLSAVGVLDSSGLNLLIDLQGLCREMALPMQLRAVPDRVRQLLAPTGLDQSIAIE